MQINLEVLLADISITTVCNRLLDKLDKQPMSQRSNNLTIPIDEKQFSELYSPSEIDEDIRLEEKIHALISLGLFEVQQTKKKAYLPLSQRNARLVFNADFEENLRVFYNREIEQDNWLEALNEKNVPDKKLLEFFRNNPLKVKNKSDEEVVQQLLRWSKNIESNSARRESARCFWGLSKIFDNQEAYKTYFNLGDMSVSLLLYMQTSMVNEVLFIENKDTFYEVCDSKNEIFKNSVIIYASGYQASAKRIRQRNGSTMYLESSSGHTQESFEKFEVWFYRENNEKISVYFWGDLDYEGIHILKALKVNFENIDAWENAYRIMLEEVKKGFGHTPEMSGKERQILVQNKLLGCHYADKVLIPRLLNKALFLDQEFINIDKLS